MDFKTKVKLGSNELDKITVCKKMCIECGFHKDSQRGTLHKELIEYVMEQKLFPCHLELKKVTGSENEGCDIYCNEVEEVRVCRGLIECMYISQIEPINIDTEKLYSLVKDNISEGIMNLGEVVQHHSPFWRKEN